jgi:hypothetical protein
MDLGTAQAYEMRSESGSLCHEAQQVIWRKQPWK